MQKNCSRLTVFFEEPFWVGVYERICDGRLEVCKITFGAEPKDIQVYEFLLRNRHRLRFSAPVKSDGPTEHRKNPKRIQREITRQLSDRGVGSRSQQALKLQQQEGKEARRKRSRQEREAEEQRKFRLRQQKKKAKKKGH